MLTATTGPWSFTASGSSGSFAIPAPVYDTSALALYAIDSSGVFYTPAAVVTLAADLSGATVAVASGLTSGDTVTVYRLPKQTQTQRLNPSGPFPSPTVERQLDRAFADIQALRAYAERALRLPMHEAAALQLADVTVRANQVLAFDADGLPIYLSNVPVTPQLALGTIWQTALLTATAALARTALGVPEAADVAHLVMPQGRLTLSTGVPVMTAAQLAKTTLFYTPYTGNRVPVWNGSSFVDTVFAELSNITTNAATGKAGPAAVAADTNYDAFVWSDAGTLRLTRSAAWNSATGRSATTENDLQRVAGVWVNLNAIANGPAAGCGTYVGTVRSNGSSQLNWQPGAVAANGTAALLNVWNAYNRVDCCGLIGDSTDSWSYSTATVRAANASNTMRASFVTGLQEDFISAEYRALCSDATGSVVVVCGIGYDSTSTVSGRPGFGNLPAGAGIVLGGDHTVQPLGFHFLQAVERGGGGGAGNTWQGDGGAPTVEQTGLSYRGRF